MARSPWVFDKRLAESAVDFFPRFLKLVDGEWAGRPFHLSKEQAHHTGQIFGWRRRSNGTRRYRTVRGWEPRKNGKGLALDTPLPTPSGWTTIGQVRVGDVLYDERGLECRVTFVSDEHHLDCYEIEFSNEEKIVCDGDHRWLTTARVDKVGSGGAGRKVGALTRARDVRNLFATQSYGKRSDRNHSLAMPAPIVGRSATLPLDPYVLGLWLGDGASHYAAITIGAQDREELVGYICAAGVPVWVSQPKRGTACLAHLTEGPSGQRWRSDCVQSALRHLGVLRNKRIPALYLRGGLEQRLALLQGLMDSDGHVANGGNVLELVTTTADLGDDYAELLASLGIKFSRRVVRMRCSGEMVPGLAHRFQFCVSSKTLPVFRLRRKLSRQKTGDLGRSRTVQICSVRPVPTVPTKCLQVDSPSHLFRCGHTMLPTHNTEWFAGLGHLMAIADGEPGAQVFSYATDKSQASILFDKAARMAALSDPLAQIYEVTKTGLFCASLMSTFRPLSGESTGKHGLSPHAALGDECHEWPDGKLHTFLRQGMGARRQPIDAIISTAGEIKTYGHDLYEDSKRIFEDPTLDPETYVFIYEADQDDDWTDPAVWAKANPNLGISLKREFLEAECKRAQQSPRLENDFKRYHLNLWVEQTKRWFPMHRWAQNTAQPDDPLYWKKLPELMRHRRAFAGVDLGSTSDITAEVLIFPPDEEWPRTILVPRFWVPEDSVAQRDSPRSPYKRWVAEGALHTTPGNVTDYDFIEAAVMKDAEAFHIAGLAIDRWNATQVAVHLGEEGLPIVLFGQGYASMGAPSKELERLFLAHELEHGNHPVLEWMFRNAAYRRDPAGNIKPDKERAAEKIDGVVGAVMGIGLASAGVTAPMKSYLEGGDLLVL